MFWLFAYSEMRGTTCSDFSRGTMVSFIWTWNDFLQQLLYLNKPDLMTVPLALRQFVSAMDQSSFGQLFAMSTLALGPVMLFFIFGQKYLVEGISTTGFKG